MSKGVEVQVDRSPVEGGTGVDLEKARLDLYDAASSLRPIAGPQEIKARVRAVARELRRIQEDLLLYLHCEQLEAEGIDREIETVERKLADGWRPEGASVEAVVARLRASYRRPA